MPHENDRKNYVGTTLDADAYQAMQMQAAVMGVTVEMLLAAIVQSWREEWRPPAPPVPETSANGWRKERGL